MDYNGRSWHFLELEIACVRLVEQQQCDGWVMTKGNVSTPEIKEEKPKVRERKEQPLGMLLTCKLYQNSTKDQHFLPFTSVCSLFVSDSYPFLRSGADCKVLVQSKLQSFSSQFLKVTL